MKIKTFIHAALLVIPMAFNGIAQAGGQTIPWAKNTGDVESNHIAAVGQNLNAGHQQVTKTQEGVWAANTGSIADDEKALTNAPNPASNSALAGALIKG